MNAEPYIFDASALVALFDSNDQAMVLWSRADAGQVTLVFPAAAVARATDGMRATFDAWSPILWPDPYVTVAPLDTSGAVEVGLLRGEVRRAPCRLRGAPHPRAGGDGQPRRVCGNDGAGAGALRRYPRLRPDRPARRTAV